MAPRQRSRKSSQGGRRDDVPRDKSPPIPQRPRKPAATKDREREPDFEKDAEEEELDRLVLGNGNGVAFEAELDRMDEGDAQSDQSADETEDVDAGLENVDDTDLFFLDSGPTPVAPRTLVTRVASNGEEAADAPAWEDSDDDRLTISLANNTRLRKLRVNENDDSVSGREYSRRLRRQFERINPVPEWATDAMPPAKRQRRSSAASYSSSSSNEMDVDEADLSTLPLARLLQNAGSLTRAPIPTNKRPKLRPEVIDIQRSRDIPLVQPSAITSLSFHPEYPVILSSGPASTLYLHHIAPAAHPTPNPLLTSVHIRGNPLYTSAFLRPHGDKIFFAGRRPHFHTWDMPSGTVQKVTRVYGHKDEQKTMEKFKLSPCGKYMAVVGSAKKGGGIINVLDAASTQWVASARIEGNNGVADFSWWRDGMGMTIVGKGGEVGEWSVESRSFITRWIDDGYSPTVVTMGGKNGPKSLGGDRWIVIGSQSGIVNIYDRRNFISPKGEVAIPERPLPAKSFGQFTKPTSHLEISPDGQILVFSAGLKKNALRLVHLPSCTVYKNWPTDQTPLGRVSSVAFSQQSDMLAVANDQGKIRLFEIRA
ncbi:U3 small nucleolar RNA-associated protein-like protein [Amylocarpus encephaloides]|uniref:U3 small nucleolar RNA-associated protein-like protein n=1 Tax=Amylocarpus encephaloides TaxID=45428 RepID=A0A9P7Y8F3_9HELO|nr:U3 small nucleolar RNA-associated protein-like protein [Amylocarpus encephaloides]